MFKIAGILSIILVGIVKSIYPDKSYDVGNYHLIAQNMDFVNYFEIGFGGGNFQIWGFRLGDRLFSPFINTLGYRQGTILNALVIALLYVQVSDLIDSMIVEEYKKQKLFNSSVLAILVVFVHDVAMEMSTYMVDLLALPLLIEMLRICVVNDKNSRHEYFAVLAGIAFAIKITNVVFIIPLLLVYLIKNRKRIKGIDWIKCFAIGLIPSVIYVIYNCACTGSPVFPYMNSVFKSRYFLWQNFHDNRWGPTNIKEVCLWIFYHIFMPKYRQSEIPNRWTLNITISLIIFVVCVLISINAVYRKEKHTLPIEIYVVFIISGVLWAITTGYSRYFVLGDVLLLLIFLGSFTSLINKKIIRCGFATALIAVMLLCSCLEILDVLLGREWSWRRPGRQSVLDELNYVFRDQPETFAVEQDIDAFFLTESYYGGFAFLSNKEAPIFNAPYRGCLEEKNLHLYDKSFQEILTKEKIYDVKPHNYNKWELYESELKNYGLEIADKCVVNNGGFELLYIRLSKCHFDDDKQEALFSSP